MPRQVESVKVGDKIRMSVELIKHLANSGNESELAVVQEIYTTDNGETVTMLLNKAEE